METISHLRTLLITALGDHGSQNIDQELFDSLMVHKSRLVNVFNVGDRNPQEQKEIEAGKTVINGKQVAVNADFARQVVFLSQHLECSERYMAGLLHHIMTQNPNITPVSCLELAVAEFHSRRRYLVDCLRYLLEASEAAESSDAPPLLQHLDRYVRTDLIKPQTLPTGGEITLARRIFQEIENLGKVIVRADNTRRSAQTNTVFPQQGSPMLGFDISNARYDSLKYERRNLATCLYLIARLGVVSSNEIKTMVEWMITNPNHGMTFYVLTTVLGAFDTVDPNTLGGRHRSNIANDKAFVSFMTKKLDSTTEWKEPGLKATILLKWTLFLTEHRHRNPSLENSEGFRTEELEVQIWNAVQGDIFLYLSMALLQLRRSTVTFSPSLLSGMTLSPEQQEQREVPADDFKVYVLNAFEAIVRSLITHASSELRKIKQRQEDLVLASARTDRARANPSRFRPTSTTEPEKQTSPRNDIAMLYSFIGLLYSNLPAESALQFWGAGSQVERNRANYLEYLETTAGRLPAFLQWAVWSTHTQDANMTMALYDMLAGLSKGQQCSELAYNFMARGGGEVVPGTSMPSGGSSVSWDVVFGLLESWATGHNARAHVEPQGNRHNILGGSSTLISQLTRGQENKIGLQDILLAQLFLRLLSTVVTHSVAVRVTISGHAHFRAIPTLISLIPLRVPLELKGMIFETLAAFCQPGAGIPGIEICRAVWTLMERLEVINVRAGATVSFGSSFMSVKGVEIELEEIEAVHGLYPATIPFLKLLSTLIHTPKRIPLKDRVSDQASTNTIPESLGQPYRLPGIGPFVNFVIDNVFSKISLREYRRPSERWQMNDLCLAFIKRILASYDMESLLASAEEGSLKESSVVQYLVHPGYEVMKRMLTSSNLQGVVLSYVVEGLLGFEKGFAEEEPFFKSTIIRRTRNISEVLDILFGNESVLDESVSWQEEVFRPFREIGQSHLKIIEFVQSLTFEWEDSLAVKPVDLQLLAEVNLQACLRKDAAGCEIIDRSSLLMLLTTARRALFAHNKIVTPVQAQQLEAETSYILESSAIENHRRQVVHAVSTGFEAWRRVLDITLTRCFDYLPQDHRENMLFDILHVLPTIIKSEDIHESTVVLLSEVVLSSMTKLHEDRRHQVILQSAGGEPHSELLPAERLYLILRNILDCIVGSNHIELVRGNLYAALINYVNLVSSPDDSMSKTQMVAVSAFTSSREGSPFNNPHSLVPHVSPSQNSQLQMNSLALLKTGLERLLTIVARDAIDGTEVWKTVAFMLLDSLVQLSPLEKQHPVLIPLKRHGILSNFVQGIKESDSLLQSVLKPDPDDLNPLYVYESKMSFFICMAETRAGAERPESDSSFVDHDSFLPSAIQRYHNLFMPSLQIVVAMLATLGGKHATASNQALDFISRHSATIVILLKNETGYFSLALLEELDLLVTLCAEVLPLVPRSEMASTHSGFGAINAAILGLSTKCLGSGTWTDAIKPVTDGEVLHASVVAPEVRRKEQLLRKALITYAGATSEFTEPELNLVFSPVYVASRYDERSSHFLATIPTIGDALEVLNLLCQDLAATLKHMSDIFAELSARDLIAVDNIQEIVGDLDLGFIKDLEIGQKRNLICRQLEKMITEAQRDAKTTLNTLEMLLLLLWRHIMSYAEGTHPHPLNTSTATAVRLISSPDPGEFRLQVGKKLQRLESLMMNDSLSGDEWRASRTYMEIMSRRLRDSTNMVDADEETS
ncbi:nucleoporin Nup186/Nup192/Nup205 [Lentinula raphanica]|uniref:Nucleoporin Nup186/Nup192/Nup205 n=1 Tax=Lentinula raphanica TaxID=153919 RepID=A0AA38PI29_9AGAR|nr:nucleoporin Nup186/Nup192/Nup205 [Lentinula raphanica]